MSAIFGNGGTRSELGKWMQAQNNDRNLRKTVSHSTAHPRSKFNGQNIMGYNPKSERKGYSQIQNKSSLPAGVSSQSVLV